MGTSLFFSPAALRRKARLQIFSLKTKKHLRFFIYRYYSLYNYFVEERINGDKRKVFQKENQHDPRRSQ